MHQLLSASFLICLDIISPHQELLMRSNPVSIAAALAVLMLVLSSTAGAQWLNYPTPGIPRLPDGKPNLSAPAPRTADGKPDLAGIWFIDQTPEGEFGERPLALRSEV